MICFKCSKSITQEKAIYKKHAPLWWHRWYNKGWHLYSGYFCPSCAKQVEKNKKLLLIFIGFWFLIVVFAIIFFLVVKHFK